MRPAASRGMDSLTVGLFAAERGRADRVERRAVGGGTQIHMNLGRPTRKGFICRGLPPLFLGDQRPARPQP